MAGPSSENNVGGERKGSSPDTLLLSPPQKLGTVNPIEKNLAHAKEYAAAGNVHLAGFACLAVENIARYHAVQLTSALQEELKAIRKDARLAAIPALLAAARKSLNDGATGSTLRHLSEVDRYSSECQTPLTPAQGEERSVLYLDLSRDWVARAGRAAGDGDCFNTARCGDMALEYANRGGVTLPLELKDALARAANKSRLIALENLLRDGSEEIFPTFYREIQRLASDLVSAGNFTPQLFQAATLLREHLDGPGYLDANQRADLEGTIEAINTAWRVRSERYMAAFAMQPGKMRDAVRQALLNVTLKINDDAGSDLPLPSPSQIVRSDLSYSILDRHLEGIFGTPDQAAVHFDPRWRSETVISLAIGIWEDSAPDRLPILADALEDAGCDEPKVLSHCRDPESTHASHGCSWVILKVLGNHAGMGGTYIQLLSDD